MKTSLEHETKENEDSVGVEGKQDNEQPSQGGILPNTATNTFNVLIIGSVLLLVGGVIYLYKRRVE